MVYKKINYILIITFGVTNGHILEQKSITIDNQKLEILLYKRKMLVTESTPFVFLYLL